MLPGEAFFEKEHNHHFFFENFYLLKRTESDLEVGEFYEGFPVNLSVPS